MHFIYSDKNWFFDYDDLLKNMFNDLCLLSDEYAFNYKQELKNILNEK